MSGVSGAGRDRRLLAASLVAVDSLALTAAVGMAGGLRLVLDGFVPVVSLGWAERHVVASVLLVPVLLVLFRLQGLYEVEHITTGTREYAQVAHAVTYGVFIALGVSYFAGGPPLVSRSWLLLVWLASVGCAGLGRFAVRRVVRQLRRRGRLRRRVVVVGASSLGVAIAEQLQAARCEGLDVVGFLDEYLPLGESLLPGVPVTGRPSDLRRGAGTEGTDEYILVPQALPHERLEEITRLMVAREGPVLRMAVSSSDLLTNGVLVAQRGSVPVVTLRRARLGPLEAMLKGGLDRFGAALALALLAPLALVALLRGCLAGCRPLISRFPIYGAGGRRSELWLFGPEVAAWLPVRGVPALVSVLCGHVSLVGPRPVVRRAGEPAPAALWLTAVKPGLTGPWRLSGPGASLDDQAVQDLAYVRNYSIWEDLRILWESVWRLRRDRFASLLARWHECDPMARLAAPGAVPLGVGEALRSGAARS